MNALLPLLALAAVGPPLAETERALMRQAQTQGQLAALRGAMAPDALLLDPEVQPAPLVLARRTAPVATRQWWPSRSLTSCDGGLALSMGSVRGADGRDGRYFTLWERQENRSWAWVFDGLVEEAAVLPADGAPAATVAACRAPSASADDPAAEAGGASDDGTVRWRLVRALDRDRHRLVVEYQAPGGWRPFMDATVS